MSERPLQRAVLVVPVMPSAGGNGLAMRAGLLLEGLSRAYAVDLVTVPVFGPAHAPSAFAAALADRIHMLTAGSRSDNPAADMAGRLRTAAGRARAEALHPLPALSRAATPAASEAVAELAADAELVLVMRTYLAPVLDELLNPRARPPLVLDVDDIESDTQRSLGHSDEAARLERLESHYLPLVDRVIACSEADASLLADRHGVRDVVVIPNAVRIPAERSPSAEGHDLLLVGTLSYAPNVEAARWLVEDVLPLLGDARIAIVGSRPPDDVLALAENERVLVQPDVHDVAPWYASSKLAVVPVRRGGGTHIKLIEALAHGLPVVSTPAGARGLPWPDAPAPVLIGDTAAEFAAACATLLSNPEGAAEMGRLGRELITHYASVDTVAPRIASLARGG